MENERILTLHPEGKQGVNILKRKYNVIKDFIIQMLTHHHNMSFQELAKVANDKLSTSFDGKVTWYLVTVKLDLEARGIITRIPNTSPHELRLVD